MEEDDVFGLGGYVTPGPDGSLMFKDVPVIPDPGSAELALRMSYAPPAALVDVVSKRGGYEFKTPGPWDDEPHFGKWRTAAGLDAVIFRSCVSGALVGYVGVTRLHPWFGIDYNGCVKRHKPLSHKAYINHLRALRERARSRKKRDLWKGIIEMHSIMGRYDSFGKKMCKCQTPAGILEVHGGVTFSGPDDEFRQGLTGEPNYWFGFDTSHAGDMMPSLEVTIGTYRDFRYVVGECETMAEQLAKIAEEAHGKAR